MDKHDQSRKDVLIKILQKAEKQAEKNLLYLTANNRDPLQIADAALASEHILIALEHLGVAAEEEETA